jgi:hypothetical protein
MYSGHRPVVQNHVTTRRPADRDHVVLWLVLPERGVRQCRSACVGVEIKTELGVEQERIRVVLRHYYQSKIRTRTFALPKEKKRGKKLENKITGEAKQT